MNKYTMVVSKKEEVTAANGEKKNEYVKKGEVEVFYPLLSELGFAVEPIMEEMMEVGTDSNGNKIDRKVIVPKEDEDGFPSYKDEKAQYVFDAVLAAVKSAARNKLVTGTATIKPGLSIASTIEELMEGGNKGDALAATREFLAAFKAWLPLTKKSEKVQAAVYDLAKNKAGLSLQPDDKKEKFLVYITDFTTTLNAEQATRFERALTALEEACTAGDALDDM